MKKFMKKIMKKESMVALICMAFLLMFAVSVMANTDTYTAITNTTTDLTTITSTNTLGNEVTSQACETVTVEETKDTKVEKTTRVYPPKDDTEVTVETKK